jgi:hypothetical protein
MTSEPLTGAPDGDAGHVAPPAETAETAGAGAAPSVEERHRRSPTIRLKLTLWYGGLFLLAGVLLIAINFFMVRDSLTPAPEKARAAVAERFGIPPEALEFESMPGVLGHLPPGEMQRYVQIPTRLGHHGGDHFRSRLGVGRAHASAATRHHQHCP